MVKISNTRLNLCVLCDVCLIRLHKSLRKMGFHSQLPGVGIDRGVFGVPGTSNTSSSNDLAKPFGLTGIGSDWFLFGRSSSLLLWLSFADVDSDAWRELGKFVSSIPWFNSSASKLDTSKRLISDDVGESMCVRGRISWFFAMAQTQRKDRRREKIVEFTRVRKYFCWLRFLHFQCTNQL